jgi:FkbM family methyltransferase
MEIYNELGKKINLKKVESAEQNIAKLLIKPDDIVLELGARYGSVSCSINKILSVKTNQVSVEPDMSIFNTLSKNREINNCNFHIVYGFISQEPKDLNRRGYGSFEFYNENSTIPHYTLEKIKSKYGITKFNVLVADCEGCLCSFMTENPCLYEEIELLIFEKDKTSYCNYKEIENNLSKNNFYKIISGFQNAWSKRKYPNLNNTKFNRKKKEKES